MFKHVMLGKPGWWILHVLAILATFLLGVFTTFD